MRKLLRPRDGGRPGLTRALAAACCLVLCVGCAPASRAQEPAHLRVVTTTALLADLVRNVGGDRVVARSLVPPAADPHSYEPSLRDVREVVYADVAFSNYLMLEQHSVIKTLDANLPRQAINQSLAEESTKYGAEVIPLVENANLDTIWLGMRVRGTGADLGADRTSEVTLSVTGVEGPGQLSAYIAGTFGAPKIVASTHDGFQPDDGYARDSISLPTDAHTHLSWAFGRPGVYRLHLRGALHPGAGREPVELGEQVVTFAVGPDPRGIPELAGRTVLDHGHADLTADLDSRSLTIRADGATPTAPATTHALDQTVVWVPSKALTEPPATPAYRFLGKPGELLYQLPQAVLGAHVHGEIDPHLWMNVRNVKAYVKAIQATLTKADPAGAQEYATHAQAYLEQLDALDKEVGDKIAAIPEARRQLITTHDGYGYLAAAYGIRIAGFVTSNPGAEPSLAQRRKLADTVRSLDVPAVFLEPTVLRRSSVLASVARDADVRVCTIYADSFDSVVRTYLDLMRYDANSLVECLA